MADINATAPQVEEVHESNRAEKKARKALEKLGLEAVPEVTRVVMKRNKQVMFVVAKPDVFKAPGTEAYIVFGEAKVEDLNSLGGLDMSKLSELASQVQAGGATAGAAAAAPAEDGEEVQAGDLAEEDISVVMEQGPATRNQAIKALQKHDGDVVEAIMDVSK